MAHLSRKWDGTRVLAICGDAIVLQNRNGVIYTIRLPEVVKALEAIPGKCTLDGEAVFIDSSGQEEFTPSQRRCSTHFPDSMLRGQYPITLEIFDALVINGENLEKQPYFERKDLLHKLLAVNSNESTLAYVPYESDLPKAWTEVIKQDREGFIAKKTDSPYEHERSYSWLKVKNWRFAVCHVVGFTPGKNSRSSFFGSLILEKDGKYIGCVGGGFNEWQLRHVKDTIVTDAPRTEKPFDIGEPYTPVRTDMQVMAKFYKTTDAGVMRFPVFIDFIE